MQRRSLANTLAAALVIATSAVASTAAADAGDRGKERRGEASEERAETPKKTHSRAGKHGRKVAKRNELRAQLHPAPCVGPTITLDRTGMESQHLRLVDCQRRPVDRSRLALSVLARPWGAPKPALDALERDAHEHGVSGPKRHAAAPASVVASREIAPGVRLLDPGLMTRLDAISRRFEGKPISLVSGYRPRSQGSQHQSARALDLRVAGVRNEELVAFCKTLKDTGCGYYPNSSFVHVDVRNPGTGSVTWIDASGPGEGPRYVTRWPLPDDAAHASLPTSAPVREPNPDPWAELDDHDDGPAPAGFKPHR